MRLILLRHGETLWNIDQRLQGHENSDLSPRGRQQALRFRPYVTALAPAQVVASDLGRTRETARLIGYPDAPTDQRLRELHMGAWTGRAKPELIAQEGVAYAAWRAGTHVPIGGEAWVDFRARVVDGLRDWVGRSNGDVLAVVHSGVVRAALSGFLNIPPAHLVPITPGAAAILNFEESEIRLEGYNIGALAPDEDVAD